MTLIKAERIYSGRVLNLDADTVKFPDGSTGQLEMIRHPGASAVLPFLDDPAGQDPRVVLIRQFRHAAGDFIYEIPAGRLDPGESPQACAARELEEETGYTASRFDHLTTIFTTPALPMNGFTCSWPPGSPREPISARLMSFSSFIDSIGPRSWRWLRAAGSSMGRPWPLSCLCSVL
jgi:8-oxo-dGTP pyrophosphatase MutT (NUDIX family)